MARKCENGKPKINIRESNGRFYASTSTSRMVNGEKVTETVYLGRYDPETGQIIEKKARGKQRPKEAIEASKAEMDVIDLMKGLSTREYGSVYLLDRIQRRCGLGARIQMSFGPRVGRAVMGVTMALCIHGGAFRHVEDTLDRTMIRELYGLEGRYSSEELSAFTRSIGMCSGNIDDYFGMTVASCGPIVSWDTTTEGTYSKLSGLADYVVNNKDNEDIPQVKKAFASDRRGVPVMFELYPGTMSDMATLKTFVDRIRRYGRADVVVVMDRGFGSGSNILYMIEVGMSFVVPANMDTRGAKTMVTRFNGRRNEKRIFDGHSYEVWETEMALVPAKRRNTDGSQAYDIVPADEAAEDAPRISAFVCHDTKKQSDEIQNLDLMIHGIRQRLDAVDSPDPMREFRSIVGKASKYFEAEADGRKVKYRVRNNAVSFAENRAGIFFMLATKGTSWEDMMASYDARRLVEQNFDRDKTAWGRLGSSDRETILGREFLRFTSLTLTCELAASLREAGLKEGPEAVLNSMGAVAAMGRDDRWVTKNIVKKHRVLLEKLGIDPMGTTS